MKRNMENIKRRRRGTYYSIPLHLPNCFKTVFGNSVNTLAGFQGLYPLDRIAVVKQSYPSGQDCLTTANRGFQEKLGCRDSDDSTFFQQSATPHLFHLILHISITYIVIVKKFEEHVRSRGLTIDITALILNLNCAFGVQRSCRSCRLPCAPDITFLVRSCRPGQSRILSLRRSVNW